METQEGHLLLVDDNEPRRNALARQLEQLNYPVRLAANSSQGLALLQAERFGLVLLSLTLAPISCYQIIDQLKTDANLEQTPVIVIAAADELDRVVKAIERGAKDYVSEPFTPALLKARLRLYLQQDSVYNQEQAHLRQMEKLASDLQQVILPVGIALTVEKDPDRLLEKIVIEVKALCNADAGLLYLRTEDDLLRLTIRHSIPLDVPLSQTIGQTTSSPISWPLHLYDETTGQPNYRNVATYAVLQAHSVNIPDIYTIENFDFSATKEFDRRYNYRTISMLAIPLKNDMGRVIGVLELINAKDASSGQIIPFDSYHQLVAESLTSMANIALNMQRLLAQREKLLKIEHDVHIGQQIQLDFLPKPDQLPQSPGWEIATYFHAAREVAGDFFDAFPIQNKIGLVIADVCDKGVGAALFMSLSRSLIRAFAEHAEEHWPLDWLSTLNRDQPSPILNIAVKQRQKLLSAGASALLAVELTNNYIANNHGDMNMFATLFFGVLDPATGLLTYINGGHPAPAIISSTGQIKTRLPPTGPAVGMLPDMEFDIQQVRLEPGDILFTFSDGVTDARSPDRKFFTEKSLLPLLEQPVASAPALLERIEASLRAHIATTDQFDDITMLAVRRAPLSET